MRKGEQTRQEIIRKAAPIFNQKGYDGAALSDLMRATGLEKRWNLPALREQAGTRRASLRPRLEARNGCALRRNSRGSQLPWTGLKQIVRNFRDRRTGLVPGGCPLLNTAIDSDDGNPQLRAKARQALSSWLDRLQAIAEEGKRRGEVRSDVDSAQLAMLIVRTLEGSLMIRRLQKNDGPLDLACRSSGGIPRNQGSCGAIEGRGG